MNADNNLVSVENIIYGSFVKMNRLQPLTINTFSNTSIAAATELNIFIDLYSVLKSVFSESHRTNITDYTAITSGIINMCSHYRSFFKQLSVKTNFYLIFSFNTCDINRKFVSGYNEEFFAKSQIPLFNKLAMDNFDLLELICPYLPDIHFIKSPRNFESAVIIANLIETINDGNPNLIISKDLYPLQLCYQYPYTSYLYPIKRKGGIDESVMIPISEKHTFRYEFWNLIASIRKFDVNHIVDVSPVNFPLFSALNRFPERGISSISNVVGAKNIIQSVVGSDDVIIIPQQLYENTDIASKIPVAKVESRMKVLDVQFMLPYYKADPESKSIKLQNLRDDSAINMINAKFFAHNPIDLNKL